MSRMARKRKPHRKRTSKDVPAKGRLKDLADKLWAIAVKADWAGRCAVCGRRHGKIEAHHIIPRQHELFHYELLNGIALCSHCHRLDADSAHGNAAWWKLWLRDNYPALHEWYFDTIETQTYKQFKGTTNPAYYIAHIRRLRQYVEPEDFERTVGVRFAAYLESEEPQ